MAYRFNNGQGAVTCDECYIMFDSDLSYSDYEAIYGKDEVLCWQCKQKKEKKQKKVGHSSTVERKIVDLET